MLIFLDFHLILAFKLIFRFTFCVFAPFSGLKLIFRISFYGFDPDCVMMRPWEDSFNLYPYLLFILFY